LNAKNLESAGSGSTIKPHVLVVKNEMDDVFYYGIQGPTKKGFLCERIDISERVETAAAVIVDLTDVNPNVYLELGYAWGKERPTILLPKEDEEPLLGGEETKN